MQMQLDAEELKPGPVISGAEGAAIGAGPDAAPDMRLRTARGERPRICAVIVTYFPGTDLGQVLAALAPQVDEVLIVDNGSSAQKLQDISAAANAVKATFVPLGSNRGIAHALNVGLEHARRHDCQWLATFDQDSVAAPSMLDEMLSAMQHYPQPGRIAVLAPVQVDPQLGLHLEPDTCELQGSGWRVLYTTMTSGNLVAVAAATAIGGFEESFFIDYVDHEFCLRLRRHGYQVLEVRDARLSHSLGELCVHRLGGRRIWVTNHSVTRRYYMSRNRLILWWRYFRSERTWVMRDMRGFATELLRIVLYERESGAKLRMVVRGSLDAIRGVRGPLSLPATGGPQSVGSSPIQDARARADRSASAFKLADVCAVVVTYHPKAECVRSLAAIARQVRELLIVDNGSSAASFAPVEEAAARVGARIVRLGSNRGIAAALNLALEHAREHGFTWLATFDQDSCPGEGLLEAMLQVLESYPEPDRVALVTPVQVEEACGVTSVNLVTLAQGSRWRLLRLAITSGNLLNVAAASRVGGFDASLFIDYVDHEICLRLRREGYQILEASEVRLVHSLGTMEVRRFLGKRPRISHHSRLRRYYITRNRALLWRQYGSFDRRWMVNDVHRFLNETAAVVLWEKDVSGKLWMMARGLIDAARNVRGELKGRPG